ncbi:glycosyltransferase [Aurantimonas manganoxydans]|uniref:glycosyltransferase n=1 Tax=Aurantimonas manganoxydans TaxID=651183 RepID=UPI001AEC8074|nr:glycosyltransferase [Aurantimonas manganoxydans]
MNLVKSVGHLGKRCRTIGIIDPNMPALENRFSSLVDEIRLNSYIGDLQGSMAFVELSPMTHDPLFVGRIINDVRVLTASIVYDFIPLYEPDRYLPDGIHRIDYQTQLIWLSRYDHFFPISQHTSDELSRILNVPHDRITKTAAPVEAAFERRNGVKPKADRIYVLACGGAEPRKNIECAIKAHARSTALQDSKVELWVSGNYPASWQATFRDLYVASGGHTELLHFIGFVSLEKLSAIYRNAVCAIVAARMEGFSIPIVEAMAANVPVIASRIPAHRELIDRDALMFDPQDDEAAGALLEKLVYNGWYRHEVVREQSTGWSRFRAEKIASEFWAQIAFLLTKRDASARPNILKGARPRVAFMTPLPPDPSGVADYSAATLKELGKRVHVDVFTDSPLDAKPEGVSSVFPISELPFLNNEYDRLISVVGNSHFHTAIVKNLLIYGGACIEHDNRLLHFYTYQLGHGRACEVASRELGRPVDAAEIDQWLSDEASLDATFLGELASVSSPLVLHSPVTAELVRRRFGKPVVDLPFSIYRIPQVDRGDLAKKTEARSRLGIKHGEFAIVTLGYIHPNKSIVECIQALALLLERGVRARLYCVGDWAMDREVLKKVCDDLGVSGFVQFTGAYVTEETYRDYLLAADAGIQLRTHLLGGLSGALLDCIAAGIPSVANADLVRAMAAPKFIKPVEDHPKPESLADALQQIAGAGQRQGDYEEERQLYCQEHSFANYTDRLCAELGLEISVSD